MKKAIKITAIILLGTVLMLFLFIWLNHPFAYNTDNCGPKECPKDTLDKSKKVIMQFLSGGEKVSYLMNYNPREPVLGIKNQNSDALKYKIQIDFAGIMENNSSAVEDYDYSKWFTTINPAGGFRVLKPNNFEIIEIPLVIPKDTKYGVYQFNLKVIDNNLKAPDNLYYQDLILVKV